MNKERRLRIQMTRIAMAAIEFHAYLSKTGKPPEHIIKELAENIAVLKHCGVHTFESFTTHFNAKSQTKKMLESTKDPFLMALKEAW